MRTHRKDDTLEGILLELKERTGEERVIVMEATGHYHRGILSYLEREGYPVIVVNPFARLHRLDPAYWRRYDVPKTPGNTYIFVHIAIGDL